MSAYGDSFTPGAAVRPVTKIELSVSCKNLVDKDLFSKSDPFVVLFQTIPGTGRRTEIGRTETVKDDLNPEFQKKFLFDYFFEERQMIELSVYDNDDPNKRDLGHHDLLGSAEVAVGEIVSSPQGSLTRPLRSQRINLKSTITIRAEEIVEGPGINDLVKFQVKGIKLDKKDFFGKSDPYLQIYRVEPNGSLYLVYKTEVIDNTLDPSWRPFDLTVGRLCKGDYNAKLKIDCFDYDSVGDPDFIGTSTTSLQELIENGSNGVYPLINPKKQSSKKDYKNSGNLHFPRLELVKSYSFLEYVKGGTDINFTVAIDFTASNGAPNDPRSLHYMGGGQVNQYMQAIRAVGGIIQDYDSDKLFPALGFGAKIPPRGDLSHEFFLNGHPTNPYCQGVHGIVQAYQDCVGRIQFYGPTNFSPVINHVASFAKAESNSAKNYFVLLIITDGVITDFAQTVSAIVHASHLPMSIIIIGVGEADFSAMDALDADDKLLSDGRQKAVRDIVQFVSFRDFNSGHDALGNQARLAKAVLAEVPGQLTGYMRLKGYQPGPGRPERTEPPPPTFQQATGGAPYPPQNPTDSGAAPYPPQNPTDSGAAPYPPQGSAPYPPQGGPGSAPYPSQGAPGSAPYPSNGPSGSAPYPPQGTAGMAPYPP